MRSDVSSYDEDLSPFHHPRRVDVSSDEDEDKIIPPLIPNDKRMDEDLYHFIILRGCIYQVPMRIRMRLYHH